MPWRLCAGRFDRRAALTFIESKGSDVYKCRNVWIVAGFGDDGPAVAVADEDDPPAVSCLERATYHRQERTRYS